MTSDQEDTMSIIRQADRICWACDRWVWAPARTTDTVEVWYCPACGEHNRTLPSTMPAPDVHVIDYDDDQHRVYRYQGCAVGCCGGWSWHYIDPRTGEVIGDHVRPADVFAHAEWTARLPYYADAVPR
jgi:hypothetical protein